jgi:hypothetical protein
MKKMKTEKTPIATISGSYAYGWQQMWKQFLYLFLVAVIVTIASMPMSALQDGHEYNSAGIIALQIIVAAYALLLKPVIEYGGDLLFLRCMRNEKIDIKEIFIGFKDNYLNIILANLLTFAIVGLGIVFLVVPGIILACRLVFVPYLVMDKKLDPVAAVEKSWSMSRGHGWKIFGMGLLAILIVIAGLLCLIVGIFFSIIWISTAFASLYYAIDLEEQAKLNANGSHDPKQDSESKS